MSDFILETRGLTKTYGTVRALDGLDLSIPRGGVYGVLGPRSSKVSPLFPTSISRCSAAPSTR